MSEFGPNPICGRGINVKYISPLVLNKLEERKVRYCANQSSAKEGNNSFRQQSF